MRARARIRRVALARLRNSVCGGLITFFSFKSLQSPSNHEQNTECCPLKRYAIKLTGTCNKVVCYYTLADWSDLKWSIAPPFGTLTTSRRAARFVTEDYKRAEIQHFHHDHQPLEWKSLEERRATTQLTPIYKIVNNLVNININNTSLQQLTFCRIFRISYVITIHI